MKLQILCDLHLDAGNGPKDFLTDADILIIPGDLCDGYNRGLAFDFFKYACNHYEYVLYVPGNHEYYGREIGEIDCFWAFQAELDDNFIFMQENVWVHPDDQDYIFIGATLWTALENPINALRVAGCMNDFRLINKLDGIPGYKKLHRKHLKWITDNLEWNGKAMKPIVITHHAPHLMCTHDKYKQPGFFEINDGFVSNLDWVFKKYPEIALWIHGHTHATIDVNVGNTRIVCNPLGYFNENREFDPKFTVEV